MRKKLSIIIPFEDQDTADLTNALASINNQSGVISFKEFDVHIVNNSGKPLDMKQFAIFDQLDLHYYELKEKLTYGMVLQYGVARSEGEYFLFLDSADLLNVTMGLHYLIQTLKQRGSRALFLAAYIEISPETNFIPHQPDVNDPSLYGKVFQRAFVKSLNLKFKKELVNFADLYYTRIIMNYTKDIILINEYVYCHQSRPEAQGQIHEKALAQRLILEKFKERRQPDFSSLLKNELLDLYLSAKLTQPVDQAAFELELSKIIKEFARDWEGYTPGLQQLVTLYTQSGRYQGLDTADLAAFIGKIEKN